MLKQTKIPNEVEKNAEDETCVKKRGKHTLIIARKKELNKKRANKLFRLMLMKLQLNNYDLQFKTTTHR